MSASNCHGFQYQHSLTLLQEFNVWSFKIVEYRHSDKGLQNVHVYMYVCKPLHIIFIIVPICILRSYRACVSCPCREFLLIPQLQAILVHVYVYRQHRLYMYTAHVHVCTPFNMAQFPLNRKSRCIHTVWRQICVF